MSEIIAEDKITENGKESVVNDSALNDSAVNDSGANGSAVNDSAANDSAVNDSAVNDSAVNDSAANGSAVKNSTKKKSTVKKQYSVNDLTIGVSGDGVFGATVGNPTDFVVHASECQERVKSGLVVAFDGPEKPDIEFDHLKDGNISVTYVPSVPGVYTLTVTYNKKHVRGSPFKINVLGRGFPIAKPLVIKRNIVKKVKLSGMQEVPVNEIAEIYLDISRAEINLELMVDIDGPMVPPYSTVEKTKGIVTLAYTPTKKGEYKFSLRFRGEHVPGSPYAVTAI